MSDSLFKRRIWAPTVLGCCCSILATAGALSTGGNFMVVPFVLGLPVCFVAIALSQTQLHRRLEELEATQSKPGVLIAQGQQ
jgi:4-hydroxybenzoate polyprenyltransferase